MNLFENITMKCIIKSLRNILGLYFTDKDVVGLVISLERFDYFKFFVPITLVGQI